LKNNNFVKNALIKFVFQEIICLSVIVLFLVICFFIIRMTDYNWLYNYSNDLYYSFINVFNFIFSVPGIFITIFVVLFITTLILLYKLIKKLSLYVEEVTDASNLLFDQKTEYIKLSPELSVAEENLNCLKREYEKSERLSKENEQKKNDLMVYLAHDIKTPLTSMIGYLSLLDEIDDMPKSKRQKYIKIALEKSYKLEDLVNELFDITRFNSEKILLEEEELNLNMMFEQILDDFYPILKEVNKEIKIIKNDKITLYGDSDKLGRVFGNVIKNAINYSSDNSEITIEIKKEEEFANIVISNKGKKISKEKLDRIFEKFYRADSSRTTKTGGSGLGLAIAKEIVELHGGEIKATSDEEFTKFYIKLPIHKH